jgi:transposase InsO family protein
MSRNRVIVEAVLAGKSHGAVARQYGVSTVWVGKLVARWREGGWVAVEKRSTRPLTSPSATDPVVVTRIVELRHQLDLQGLDCGPHTIAAHLAREGGHVPSVTTIWRILTRVGLVTPSPRKRPRSSYLRFAADLPNECWQADFTHYRLADGTGVEILLFLDDHSRFLLSATAHARVTGAIVHAVFRTTMDRHGIPASTLTDNGFVFTTRHRFGPNAFEIELLAHGITQKNGHPNHPQTQGKVERLNQTLKRWLRSQTAPRTPSELQAQLETFAAYYNDVRPHRALAGTTPATAYTARAKATPDTRDGHWRIREDKVGPGGKVTLRRGGKLHHIGLGTEHAGTAVRLLIHDLDIVIIDRETGEILRELTLDPDRDYQPLGRKPGPAPGSPQRGGVRKKTPPKQTKSRDIR